jgi:hypothetical protein
MSDKLSKIDQKRINAYKRNIEMGIQLQNKKVKKSAAVMNNEIPPIEDNRNLYELQLDDIALEKELDKLCRKLFNNRNDQQAMELKSLLNKTEGYPEFFIEFFPKFYKQSKFTNKSSAALYFKMISDEYKKFMNEDNENAPPGNSQINELITNLKMYLYENDYQDYIQKLEAFDTAAKSAQDEQAFLNAFNGKEWIEDELKDLYIFFTDPNNQQFIQSKQLPNDAFFKAITKKNLTLALQQKAQQQVGNIVGAFDPKPFEKPLKKTDIPTFILDEALMKDLYDYNPELFLNYTATFYRMSEGGKAAARAGGFDYSINLIRNILNQYQNKDLRRISDEQRMKEKSDAEINEYDSMIQKQQDSMIQMMRDKEMSTLILNDINTAITYLDVLDIPQLNVLYSHVNARKDNYNREKKINKLKGFFISYLAKNYQDHEIVALSNTPYPANSFLLTVNSRILRGAIYREALALKQKQQQAQQAQQAQQTSSTPPPSPSTMTQTPQAQSPPQPSTMTQTSSTPLPSTPTPATTPSTNLPSINDLSVFDDYNIAVNTYNDRSNKHLTNANIKNLIEEDLSNKIVVKNILVNEYKVKVDNVSNMMKHGFTTNDQGTLIKILIDKVINSNYGRLGSEKASDMTKPKLEFFLYCIDLMPECYNKAVFKRIYNEIVKPKKKSGAGLYKKKSGAGLNKKGLTKRLPLRSMQKKT